MSRKAAQKARERQRQREIEAFFARLDRESPTRGNAARTLAHQARAVSSGAAYVHGGRMVLPHGWGGSLRHGR